jgi:predicted RNA-binding Zn-ribbon protein involved in translation (DUF1610 family)
MNQSMTTIKLNKFPTNCPGCGKLNVLRTITDRDNGEHVTTCKKCSVEIWFDKNNKLCFG